MPLSGLSSETPTEILSSGVATQASADSGAFCVAPPICADSQLEGTRPPEPLPRMHPAWYFSSGFAIGFADFTWTLRAPQSRYPVS